jgi:hypothetical protein
MIGPSSERHSANCALGRLPEEDIDFKIQRAERNYVQTFVREITDGAELSLPDARTGAPHFMRQVMAYQCAKLIVEGGCELFSVGSTGAIVPKEPEGPMPSLRLVT